MKNLLDLWLEKPPEFAAPICQWMLAMLIVERITTGHMIAVNAYGKIGLYEVLQGAAFLSSLPLMWGMFQLGWGPEVIGVSLFGSALIFCTIRVLFAKHLLDFPVLLWLRQVAVPVLLILVVVLGVGSFSVSGFSEGFSRLILASMTCVLATMSLAWIILFNNAEREYVYRIMGQLLGKIPYLRGHLDRYSSISE
jgi:hypothetical protein